MWENLDKTRFFMAIALVVGILGGSLFWAKNAVPRFLAEKEQVIKQKQEEKAGQVAGASSFSVQQDVQKQIDEIKKNITQIKTDDLKDQEVVKKVLKDLDGIAKQASESSKILDVKGNLCEEAKKRFCE